MTDTIFLTLEQVLAIHDDQIELYGGSHGIHSLPLLESAIMRPQTTFGARDLYPSVFDKTAAMMHSLVMNHAFVDGNKRTATVCAVVFLKLNSFDLITSQSELIESALHTRHGEWDIAELSSWLKKHSKKI